MPAAKKYTLFSSADAVAEGGKPPCAFFASAAGCRNGANCKFAHVTAATAAAKKKAAPTRAPPDASSVVSSESESSIDDDNNNSGNTNNNSGNAMKVESEDDGNIFVKMSDMKKKETPSEKKKKRRGKRSDPDDPFANPKSAPATSNKVAKTSTETSPKQESAKKVQPPKKETTPPPPPAVVVTTTTTTARVAKKATSTTPKAFDISAMNLPISSFSCMPGQKTSNPEPPKTPKTPKAKAAKTETTPKEEQPSNLPKSNPIGRKWLSPIMATIKHARYERSYDFTRYQEQDESVGLAASAWIEAKPYGDWCANNPQVIAMDCEMCETRDPVSGLKDSRALCRISVVDVTNDKVLLDTLVKPAWPVSDYRTWVNGIAAEHLQNVQFTLRHAQAFMMAVCSKETVMVGHALQNDLAAIRMTHGAVVDSAFLFPVKDSPNASIGLKDLTKSLLQIDMPKTHDSVNDARMSMECCKVWLAKGGKVEPVERAVAPSYGMKLFVHRIPKKTCQAAHLTKMFLHHTTIEPVNVEDIEFASGDVGKTYITFKSEAHASLAFSTLEGKAEPDATGKLQKKVFLKNGGYVRVRKMIKEKGEVAAVLKKSETN